MRLVYAQGSVDIAIRNCNIRFIVRFKSR